MPERVRVEIPVRPTEREELIEDILYRIFEPDSTDRIEAGIGFVLVASSKCLSSLARLRAAIWRQRILDAARSYLRSGLREDRIEFMLHKQALSAGRVSFVEHDHESPLGAIRVIIYHPKPRDVIDWLAPRTSRGKPLKTIDIPQPDCI